MKFYDYFRASGSELCLSFMTVMSLPKLLILRNLERTIHSSFTPRIQTNIGYREMPFQLTFASQELDSTETVPAESD